MPRPRFVLFAPQTYAKLTRAGNTGGVALKLICSKRKLRTSWANALIALIINNNRKNI